MDWKKIALRGAAVCGMVIVLALVGGYFYLRSSGFKQFALRNIIEQVEKATGGRAEIHDFDFQLSTLTAHLHNIVIHGKEATTDKPLLSVDDLTVSLKIQSILRRQIYLSELLVGHPVVHLWIDSRGNSNFPQPVPPSEPSSSQTSLFDLGVRHAALTNGEINYNDRKIPVDAELHDLHFDVIFEHLARRYKGTLSYGGGEVSYAGYPAIPHSFQANFAATSQQFDLASAEMRVASSIVKLDASLRNYAAPTVSGNYEILLHAQDAKRIDPRWNAAGDVALRGTLGYQQRGEQKFLQGVRLDGQIDSETLSASTSVASVELRKMHGRYQLQDASLRATELVAEAFGGRLGAEIKLTNLDATPSGRATTELRGISLEALQHSLHLGKEARATAASVINGKGEASWTGNLSSALVRADLALSGSDSGNRHSRTATIPVEGALHLTYDGRSSVLMVSRSRLEVPSATLTADGQISNHSQLLVHVSSSDLHHVVELASSFSSASGPALAVSGAATVDATVTGSLKQPGISASLQAHDLGIQGSQWKSASLSLQANSSHLSVANGVLTDLHKGRAAFSANVALHNWSYEPSSPLQADLSASQLLLSDLQRVAGVHYPVSGELSAKLTFSGSQLDPRGSGSMEIADARVYDEPIKTLKMSFHGKNGLVATELNIVSDAGKANANLEYSPRTKEYKVSLDAPEVVLQKLRRVQEKNIGLHGTLALKATGQGTIDDPQLTAVVEVSKLAVKDKSLAGVKATLQVKNKKADVALDSEVASAQVKARGHVELAEEYPVEASIDSTVIPLDLLVAAYAGGPPQGFSGQAEVHGTLKGPLKNRSLLEAHLRIPTLKASYQTLEIAAAAPVAVDYVNSVVTLQPAEIRGTGTSIHLQGSVPLAGSSAPNLRAQGIIDARIAMIIAPTVRSSGTVSLDIRATGSASNPEVGGQIQLHDIAVVTADSPLSVDKLNGTLNLENEKVRISEMKAEVGGGQISLGGTIGYQGTKEFDLALQANSVRLRYPDGLRSVLDSNLKWTGDMDDSTVTGAVLIDSLSFTPDFDLAAFGDQFSSNATVPAEPGFADKINLQFRVQSKQNLSAISSQVSVEGSAALNVTGTAANPIITGRTDLTSGELFYRNVRYQLQRGIITFSDPNETRPSFDVSVTTTVQQYKLTLNLRGPLDTLTTSYVSDPPLSTADVINLIARGKTSSELAASSQSTDSMIASQAASQVAGNVQKLAGISSLQIDPTIGGNNSNPSARVAIQQRVTKNFLFTFSTDVSQPGNEIVQGDYQINKRWSVSVSRDQLGGVSVDGRFHTKF